jgi:hypothetical protein
MPVVLREGGLRYFFFSNEGDPREPAHIHVRGGGKDAKIWLEPEVALADSFGFSPAEIRRILWIVASQRRRLLKAWHEHFSALG